MNTEAMLTVSGAVVALTQFAKWSGVPQRAAPLVVLAFSALGTGLWVWAMGTFARELAFDIFASWIATSLTAAGVYGFTRAAADQVAAVRNKGGQ